MHAYIPHGVVCIRSRKRPLSNPHTAGWQGLPVIPEETAFSAIRPFTNLPEPMNPMETQKKEGRESWNNSKV